MLREPKTEALGSSLLVRLLSVSKVLGLNPGISVQRGENLGYVFLLKRAQWVETDLTNTNNFPISY